MHKSSFKAKTWFDRICCLSGNTIIVRLMLISVLVLSMSSVRANDEPATPIPAQVMPLPNLDSLVRRVSIDVKGFSISGENPMDESASLAIVNKYLGKGQGIDDIEAAAAELEEELRKRGETFYRVSFPPQELSDGIIDLIVRRYTLAEITVIGNEYYSSENIINSLPQLVPGSSPSSVEISRALTVANQNSGKRTKLTLSSGDNAGNIDAVLSVVDQKPLVISAWTNNTGTDVSGDYRVGASLVHRNLFGRDHVGSMAFITSPEDFDEVQQYAFNYRLPVYRVGGSANFLAVKSEIDSGAVADVFNVAGKGQVLGLGYSQVLAKLGEYRHQLSFQIMDKLFDNDISFQGTQLLPDVRTRPLSLSYQNSWQNGNGLELSSTISVVQNLSGGADNTDQSYELTRIGAEQSWSKVELAANLQYSTEKWLYTAALNLSESSDRLVTGEQFGLGGSTTVRGMEERELRGDRGVSLNLQAWGPSIFKSVRPILFLDAGWVDSNGAVIGEVSSESVLSAGVMFNWNPQPEWSASFGVGYLIDGIDPDDDNSLDFSRDGDSKLHFNITYRY